MRPGAGKFDLLRRWKEKRDEEGLRKEVRRFYPQTRQHVIHRSVGIYARFREQPQAPAIQEIIERNRALAKELGINVTPGFIVGTEFAPGALELEDLKNLIKQARQENS